MQKPWFPAIFFCNRALSEGAAACFRLARLGVCTVLFLLLLAPAAASATVRITFYSHEFGSSFPHAFIILEGEDERDRSKIATEYGFTATHVSPAILTGSVQGEVLTKGVSEDSGYIRSSQQHFGFALTPAEFDRVVAVVHKWEGLPQPSYNLNRQNCVFFVADVASALGMAADTPKGLMKKPRSYSDYLTARNRAWLTAKGAAIYREPPPPR